MRNVLVIASLLFACSSPPGAVGPKGDIGPDGVVGPQGPKGDIGPTGPIGAAGPRGLGSLSLQGADTYMGHATVLRPQTGASPATLTWTAIDLTGRGGLPADATTAYLEILACYYPPSPPIDVTSPVWVYLRTRGAEERAFQMVFAQPGTCTIDRLFLGLNRDQTIEIGSTYAIPGATASLPLYTRVLGWATP